MIMFTCDYNEGCHPHILKRMTDSNMEQHEGYSGDKISAHARELIKKACGRDDVDVHIMVSGTQTNVTVISSCLKPYQGVISAEIGHIARHETGAVEARGHKVLTLPTEDGKISAAQVRGYCGDHFGDEDHEHIVQPGMVYISNPTELGTIYKRREIEEIRKACDEYGLYLYLDGARLGYGLAAEGNDLDLNFLSGVCDVFYIGGTKQGALMGEAVVIKNPAIKKDFRYMIKQNGGMFAKGRLLGIQFVGLFENDLYMELSRHAVSMAGRLAEGMEAAGFRRYVDSPTNQQFFIMPDSVVEKLAENYGFSFDGRVDSGHRVVRFCTSWATKPENVETLLADIKKIS